MSASVAWDRGFKEYTSLDAVANGIDLGLAGLISGYYDREVFSCTIKNMVRSSVFSLA